MRAFALGPKDKLISCIGTHLKLLPLLKAIQRLSTFKSLKKSITTTSVSVLFIMTFLHPSMAASLACMKSLVSVYLTTLFPGQA